jgi:hypothetical protein
MPRRIAPAGRRGLVFSPLKFPQNHAIFEEKTNREGAQKRAKGRRKAGAAACDSRSVALLSALCATWRLKIL